MSASFQTSVAVLLIASVLLTASVARVASGRPEARWTVAASAVAGLACATLAALHSLVS